MYRLIQWKNQSSNADRQKTNTHKNPLRGANSFHLHTSAKHWTPIGRRDQEPNYGGPEGVQSTYALIKEHAQEPHTVYKHHQGGMDRGSGCGKSSFHGRE